MYRPIILALVLTVAAEALPYCGDTPPCRMWCPFGYERDEYGCAMCQCLDPDPAPVPDEPAPCEPPVCLFFQPACKVYLKNDQGCDTCECEVPLFGKREQEQREVLPDITPRCHPTPCLFYLPACVIYKKDQHGCDTCECDVAIRDIISITQRRSDSELKGATMSSHTMSPRQLSPVDTYELKGASGYTRYKKAFQIMNHKMSAV